MKYRYLLLFLMTLFAFASRAKAQLKEPVYFIYKVPVGVTNKKIGAVNLMIVNKTNEEEVFAVIDKELVKLTGKVVKIKKSLNHESFLTIDYTVGRFKRPVRNMQQWNVTRGTDDLIIDTKALQDFFPDTLYIVDTLSIGTASTPNFVPAGYHLKTESTEPAKAGLLYRNNMMLFFPFTNERGTFISCTLWHDDPTYPQLHFTISFIDEEHEDMLRNDLDIILKANGIKQKKADKKLLAQMISEHFNLQCGEIKAWNILHWLNKK